MEQMGRKVVVRTGAGYISIWRNQWVPFVRKLEVFGNAEDYYLEAASSDKVKSMIIVLFMAERYDNGFRAEKVYTCLSAMRHFFTLKFKYGLPRLGISYRWTERSQAQGS